MRQTELIKMARALAADPLPEAQDVFRVVVYELQYLMDRQDYLNFLFEMSHVNAEAQKGLMPFYIGPMPSREVH